MQNHFITIATQAARSAGRVIMRHWDRIDRITVSEKDNRALVTDADHLSEQEIVHHITKAYPHHDVMSEECGLIAGKENTPYCWVIDPLNGTTNFVHSFPHFAVSIALKKDGVLEAALIYDPIRQELFTAVKGQGAFLDNHRMRVSHRRFFKDAVIGTPFPATKKHHSKPFFNSLQTVFTSAHDIRYSGATALDLAYVAAGRLDGFWDSGIPEHEMAAGVLMLQESGALLGDFQEKDKYLTTGNLVTGNPKIYPQLSHLILASEPV